ncbi:acetylornithine deacetylase [Fructilactobacillus frigidiflavus]|uniref:acetylornithine deacetylase n=1 Tax=Fructilactobacillus frigidiflavus TaxID=3242688 RepID=UPI0037570915
MNEINLQDEVLEHKSELIDLVRKLVSYPTTAPNGRNTKKLQQWIADYLEKIDFTTNTWELYPGDNELVGVHEGDSAYQSLILNGHIDVAQINEGEAWLQDPFQVLVKDGKLIGRGVADMKGAMAAFMLALKILHESKVKLPGKIIFESVTGEEVGETGTLSTLEKGYTADFALNGDGNNLELQGQGGVITGWITIKSPQSFHDGMRRKLIHAGGQTKGASAIEKMAKIITALGELERDWAVEKVYPGFPLGTSTINPAVIEGGRNPAFIADECRLWITIHFYPNESYASVTREVEDYITRVADADVWMRDHHPTFEWGGKSMIEDQGEVFPSLEIDVKSQPMILLKDVVENVTKNPAVLSYNPSVTDGGWFSEYQIPAVIYGPGNLNSAHSVNESIKIDDLVKYTQTIIEFIVKWSNTRK